MPLSQSSKRRPISTRSATKTKTVSPDELADKLASGLVISDVKGKRKAAPQTPEENRVSAMRSVNAALQSLSCASQSGEKAQTRTRAGAKAPVGSNTSNFSDVALSARKSLQVLRELTPEDLDVERAALSVAGKLIGLEMYSTATDVLWEMRPRLASLCNSPALVQTSDCYRLLYLPFGETSDPNIQTLISTYLLNALIVTCFDIFGPKTTLNIESFPDALFDNPTLLSWIVHFSLLPSKHLDSILTRAYTVLVKSSALCSTHPSIVFRARTYGLLCLLHTSPTTVEADTLWGQATKFCATFVKSVGAGAINEEDVMATVCSSFSALISCAEKRNDNGLFLSGRGFVEFGEYCMGLATRSGDLDVVDRISNLMQCAFLTPTTSGSCKGGDNGRSGEEQVSKPSGGRKGRDTDELSLEGAKVWAILSQATAFLDKWMERKIESSAEEISQRLAEASATIPKCLPFLLSSEGEEVEGLHKTAVKVSKGLEKLRRVGVKAIEDSSKRVGRSDIVAMLIEIVTVLEGVSRQKATTDVLTPALETLFVLARSTLSPSSPDTYGHAYEFLTRAAGFLKPRIADHDIIRGLSCLPGIDPETYANYVRCVSGAFYNLAGTLYQADRHSVTVRFLQDSCTLGVEALSLRDRASSRGEGEERKQNGDERKQDESWTQLKEQLHRRWELLGVCHSKISDRKSAYEAFVECIKSYSFTDASFVQATRSGATGSVFEASPTNKQLGTIIDRVTYMATCELFRDPTNVSLRRPLETVLVQASQHDTLGEDAWKCTVGAILERQVDGLEGSKWKEGVRAVVKGLLTDALSIYEPDKRPVRRARVLLKCLEFTYFGGHECENSKEKIVRHSDEIGDEIEDLLTRQDYVHDSGLARFSPQYLASARLWLALHAHRRGGRQEIASIPTRVEEACALLRPFTILANEPAVKLTKSPPAAVAKKRGVSKTTKAGSRQAPVQKSRATKAAKREPVTPMPRKALESMSMNVSHVTPPRPAEVKKPVVTVDNFSKLLGLLDMCAQLLGLLGHVLARVRTLNAMRRLSERFIGTSGDGYVKASIELAHEYVKLGKTERAGKIYVQALSAVRSQQSSEEANVLFFLRYAESLAAANNVLRSSTLYCEALGLSEILNREEGMSTSQRVRMRVEHLERAAIASGTYSVIQHSKDDPSASLSGLLQSLRLWNRAMDNIARLNPPPVSTKTSLESSNPFDLTDVKEALPSSETSDLRTELPQTKQFHQKPSRDGLEWRIADGLLFTLFALTQAYFARGSAREAEYFAGQALELARSLNAPSAISRALAKKGEIQLHLGQLEESYASLVGAAESLEDNVGPEAADVRRLRGDYNQLNAKHKDAQQLYNEATVILEQLEKKFTSLDSLFSESRRSSGLPPKIAIIDSGNDALVPTLLATVLRQQIWLLRDDGGDQYKTLLQRFLALPPSAETKAEEIALMSKLTLHDVYNRFRADMFLSSLAESTISLPMGISGDKVVVLPPSTQDILSTLANAEKLFWSDLSLIARQGQVPHVRDSAVSLALVRALQTSLGKVGRDGPVLAASLLDYATAITLRREMVETIENKFHEFQRFDDTQWPLITPNGSPLPRPNVRTAPTSFPGFDSDEEDEAICADEPGLQMYWLSIGEKCRSRKFDIATLSTPNIDLLPENWTVINISIAEDKSMMFVSRQRAHDQALIFCVPLKGRRESDEDEHLTFEDAVHQLQEIIRLSDEGTRQAVNVKTSQDKHARAAWWAGRSALDKRLQELLGNIEFCWLGAFKTILNSRRNTSADILSSFRTSFEKVFKHTLGSQDKKQKTQVRLDDSLLECFSTLSPKCQDEELEDLVYFILDLYQVHGVQVAIAEIDVDQVAVDLRMVLEEFAPKMKPMEGNDEHTFLVLDKNVQGIPWESIPILRGRSVSRIPSMDFLLDRLEYAKAKREELATEADDKLRIVDRAVVDPRKTYYMLNPSGDLKGTEGRFKDWLKTMRKVGWEGLIGRQPSEQEFINALSRKDLVIYFGHGGAEQYMRSHKIRHLKRCAATMLWGCSSGALRNMGDFDRIGTPYNYMLAGCQTLVANLWDVTDRDIDKLTQAVFDKLSLTANVVGQWRSGESGKREVSIVTAVAQSRDACKLKYLTGGAPVVYGIPFYL